MKPILNQQLIDKYILDEFGEIPNPPTKSEMKGLINNNQLTLKVVRLWALFGNNLEIKDHNERTILNSASRMGQLDIVQYVLDKRVNVDCLNGVKSTPLLVASDFNKIEIINLLLDKGANINHQNYYKESALHYAVQNNFINIVQILVEKNTDIYLKNNKNQTALDIAKYEKHQELVDYLTPFYIKQ